VGGQTKAHQANRHAGDASGQRPDRIGSFIPARRGGSKIPPLPRGQTRQRKEVQTEDSRSLYDYHYVSGIFIYVIRGPERSKNGGTRI
jgi:hypothetical protein